MKLFLLGVGDRSRASSRLRLWDHLDWLKERGVSVTADFAIAPGVTRFGPSVVWRMLRRYWDWSRAFFCADGVYAQETFALAPLLPFRNLGKRRTIVFDFSDPVDLARNPVARWLWGGLFRYVTAASDLVVCENPAYVPDLRRRGIQVVHYYGPVDDLRYAAGRAVGCRGGSPAEALNIGWTGSPSTVNFIAPLFPILDRLATQRKVRLTLMGLTKSPYPFENIDVSLLPWQESAEFELVPTFDLGLFALDRSEHSQRRGAGKLFIYMAAGVPFIGPAWGISGALMQETGLGFSVADESHWENMLLQAIDDAPARAKFSSLGMKYANQSLGYTRFRQLVFEHHLKVGAGKTG